jgi:O-methyltransferase
MQKGVFPDAFDPSKLPGEVKFCHVDVDTYNSGRDVVEWVWPRLVSRGIVVLDDYGFWGCEGITRLGNEISYSDCIKVHNLNGHLLLIKVKS